MGNKNIDVTVAEKGTESVTSLQVNQRDSFWTKWVSNGWLLEVFSLVVGCALMAALCGLLAAYDHKEVPVFGTSVRAAVTLNTVISILSGAIQASIMFPIIGCLSQLKWTWMMTSKRPLEDIQKFDSASRGALGSLLLAYKLRWRSYASMGAALVVISVTLSPLFQQLIAISSKQITLENPDPHYARVQVTRYYEAGNDQANEFINIAQIISDDQVVPTGEYNIATGLRAAAQIGFYTLSGNVAVTDPTCWFGNCTFEYQTLGFCGRVADISDRIITKNVTSASGTKVSLQVKTGNSSIGIEYSPQNETGIFLNVTSINNKQSIMFQNRSSYIADAIVLAATFPSTEPLGPDDGSNAPIAYEIFLEWCVQDYKTDVQNGIATTTLSNSANDFQLESSQEVFGKMQINDLDYAYGPVTNQGLQRLFRSIFSGGIQWSSGDVYASTDSAQAIWQTIASVQGSRLDGSLLGGIMGNIATSMTNQIRSELAYPYQNSTGTWIQGSTYYEAAIVVVRWPWIIGPAAFIVLAAVFVLLTTCREMFGGQRLPAWKSSSLAVLAVAGGDFDHGVPALTKPSQLSSQAGAIEVQLKSVPGETRWGLQKL